MCGLKNCCFCLYSEGPKAQCVASYILSDAENLDPPNQDIYASSIHGRVVNRVKFQNFLSMYCTLISLVISYAYVNPHLVVITKIKMYMICGVILLLPYLFHSVSII